MKAKLLFLMLTAALWIPTACHKDPEVITPPVENPIDTIVTDTIGTDTTITHPPVVNDSTKEITITVYEVGSTIPAADRVVVLYSIYNSAFAPPTVFVVDSLGKTDAQGKLKWLWDKKPIPAGIKMGFSAYPSVDNNAFYPIPLSGTPPDQIVGAVFVPGFAKVHIQINKDSLQFPFAELVQYWPGNNWYNTLPNWNSAGSFSLSQPLDTTIIVSQMAPRQMTYGVRYNYDNSSYNGYVYSGLVQKQTIGFQPRDTVEVSFVIE